MGHYLYQVYITLGLAFFIILAGNNALLYASQNQFKTVGYDITSLRQLCPRADICTQGQGGSQKDSCCLTCSCDSNCKKIGNCCDGNEAIGNMCHLPLVERENLDTYGEPMYFMIDTCLNDSVYIECLVEDVAPWGWLYPVYDPVSDLNFYNHRCAECNGVQDYIYWDLKLKSSFDDRSLSHCLSAMAGDPLKDCTLGFTPPKEMEVIDHVCSIEIIHTCNVSGLWAMYDAELEHACHRWYSPVIDYISGELRYANVYCGMCNGETIAPTDVCPDTVWDRTTGIAHTDSLSMILDYKKVQKVIENQPTMKTGNAKNGLCDQYMVKHPTKDECRTILCPNGFYRDIKRCAPISTRWLASTYFVQLILTPVDPGVSGMVPWSYFTNLSTEERSSPEIWFTSHIAPLYYFEIYGSRVEIGNVSYAETMLVRIGRRRSPLNVATETKVIRAAMSQPWIVRLKGRTFVFTAKFYRHAKYITDGFMPEFEIFVDQDVTESVNQGKSASVNEGKHPPTIYELLETEFIDTPDTVLKKTHFCDRIRLSQSEWSGRGQDLYLNLGSEVSKVLGDSEFDVFTGDNGRQIVEICVADFNPHYQDHQLHGKPTSRAADAISSCGGYVLLIMTALAVNTLI